MALLYPRYSQYLEGEAGGSGAHDQSQLDQNQPKLYKLLYQKEKIRINLTII